MTRRELEKLLENVVLDAGAKLDPCLTTKSKASSLCLVLMVATGRKVQLVDGCFQVGERASGIGCYWMVSCRQEGAAKYTRIGIVKTHLDSSWFKYEGRSALKQELVDLG